MDEIPKRIDVTFGVDVPVEKVTELRQLLDGLRPGTIEYSATWDELKALHTHFLGRLDGECQAYMNIAKERTRQLFGM